MSDIEVKKLAVLDTIRNGVGIGVKNIASILVNIILWVLTCWIPYINVGTTIGLAVGIVTKAGRGEVISMTEIFNPQYRKFMGEYFLTAGLVYMGVFIGMMFLIIPGIVIGIAWSLAVLLAVDKGKNPTEAISLSNKLTYGNKWRMLAIYIIPSVIYMILAAILVKILAAIPIILFIFVMAASFLFMFVMIGLLASVYKQLTEGVN